MSRARCKTFSTKFTASQCDLTQTTNRKGSVMDELTKREVWLLRFIERMLDKSDCDRDDANYYARVGMEMQAEANGSEVSEWDAPEDAADEEMSCWDCDADEEPQP
jgi:hypothetical protein